MGAEFSRALQGLGQTFGEIAQQTAARKRQALLDARQAEQDKLSARYQEAQISNLDRDNARQEAAAAAEQATKAANTSRMAELNPILGEYPILRGAPDGTGRYSQLSGSIKPMVDGSSFGVAPKTGMGAPTAENPYDISKYGKQATGVMEISPDLAKLRAEDIRKAEFAGLSPSQFKFKMGMAGSSLPADINAAKNLDDLQAYEDKITKEQREREEFRQELDIKRLNAGKQDPISLLRMELLNKQLEKSDKVPLSESQKRDVSAVGTGANLLTSLVDEFKGVNTGDASQAVKSKISGLPIVGQRVAPKEAGYNATRRLTAETYLREATGAAAPEKEVATYEGFMPDIGDTPEQAQSKLNVFIDRIKARNEGVVSYLEASGDMKSAAKIREQGQRLLSTIPKIVNKESDSTGLPKVTDQQSFDTLPSGAEYIGPDGRKRRK